MRFTLLYRGPLHANGGPTEKHRIRSQINEQLRELWQREPVFQPSLSGSFPVAKLRGNRVDLTGVAVPGFFFQVPLKGYAFVPMATYKNKIQCQLAITFLRAGNPGDLVRNGGDLDNRLKTFFDALRIPQTNDEAVWTPPAVEGERFYCLLEDDALILSFSVEADRLLASGADENEAAIILRVTLGEELF